jgi:hypothetical protein
MTGGTRQASLSMLGTLLAMAAFIKYKPPLTSALMQLPSSVLQIILALG